MAGEIGTIPEKTMQLVGQIVELVRGEGIRVGDRLFEHRLARHLGISRGPVRAALDVLVEAGLAHRVSGPDRVYRFSAQPVGHVMHGHFRCAVCQRMFCLEEAAGLARVIKAMLPEGFSSDSVELTVSGRCGQCASAGSGAATAAGPPATSSLAAR